MKLICSGTSGVGADLCSGSIGNYLPDIILVGVVVGGTGHAETDFEAHSLTVVLRSEKDINLLPGVRVADLLKFGDFNGGFSMQSFGVAAGEYVFAVPIGKAILSEDDKIEVSLSWPGDATATYAYKIFACDTVDMEERLIGYETIVGTGADIVIRDCLALYGVSAAAGNEIAVVDQETAHMVNDYGAEYLANALGKIEAFEDFQIVWQDRHGIGQNIRAKLADSTYGLAMRAFYPKERLYKKGEYVENKKRKILNDIRNEDAEKFECLVELGLV